MFFMNREARGLGYALSTRPHPAIIAWNAPAGRPPGSRGLRSLGDSPFDVEQQIVVPRRFGAAEGPDEMTYVLYGAVGLAAAAALWFAWSKS